VLGIKSPTSLQEATESADSTSVTREHAAPLMQIAAGWYPDPHAPGWVRWWNGQMWTEHVQAQTWQPPAAPHHVAAGHDDEMRWLLPVGRPASAIAAGYLGLFSLLPNPFTALPAVICGCVALRTLDRRPDLIGRGRAIFGIVVGGLDLALYALLILGSIVG
jgi:hypothetical protein